MHLRYLAFLILLSCSNKTQPLQEENQKSSCIFPEKIEAVIIEQGTSLLGPCEPSICINPVNPEHIVAGAILDKVYVSKDGGHSWSSNRLESSLGVYGDPVVRANYKGDFFYAHLSNPDGKAYASESFLDRIVVQKSSDGGLTWNDGSYTLPRSPKDQDKQWMVIDPRNNHIYMTWTEFDLYDSPDPKHKSRILFAKSIDDGLSWSDPTTLSELEGNCLDSDDTTEGAVPSIGPDGELYVTWAYNEKLYFDRSFDNGETWLEKDLIVAEQPGGWNIAIPGLTRTNGMPITVADRSSGPHKGTVYVNWSDQKNGLDDTDIWLASSSDKGDTWSEPVRVNDDLPGNQQFLSWMEVDQSNGYIYVVFYDRRHYNDHRTDVYLAVSTDGGKTFENKKINSKPFTPVPEVFFGDYNDISVVDGKIRPIWTQLEGRRLSVWTALVNIDK